MLRVIHEIRPTWVLGENVPGIINLALDQVLADLESEGYEVQCFLIPACGVDAPHKRERIAIVAHSIDGSGTVRRDGKLQDAGSNVPQGSDNGRRTEGTIEGQRRKDKPGTSGMADGLRAEVHGRTDSDFDSVGPSRRMFEQMLDAKSFTNSSCRERERELWVRRKSEKPCGSHPAWENWTPEPGILRVVDGIPNRVDRIKCLGNAVVPQQFYPLLRAMYLVETGESDVLERI